ncbi:reverse transcriptase [Tanacetum coccineum]
MNSGEGTSHHRGQTAYGRLTKLEFPKFNGEDVQGWLYRVNLFFTMDRIQEDAQKLMLVSMHLFDHALNWHKEFLKRNMDNVTWHQYEEGIKERFDHVNEDPMVKLKNLKQVGSLQAYQDSFEVLLNKVAGYEEEIKDEDSVDSEIDQVVVRKEEVMPHVSLNAMNGLFGGITQFKPQIQTLLKEFATVFDDLKKLPPKRSHDHTIPLTPNAPPVNIRPYRHPLI